MAEPNQVRIEYVPLGELRRWPRNPKDHSLGDIHQSYDRFGYVAPMLLDERTGRLVAGHGRLDALQQRKASGKSAPERIVTHDGRWLVPVVRGVSFESDEEAEAYGIADNRLVEVGGWNDMALAQVLADLAAGPGLEGIGFDGDDLDALLAGLAQLEPVADPGAQLSKADELQEKWNVQTGDVWQCGEHRICCGDCTDAAVVEAVMDGERAGAVVTDPPYGIEREGILNDDPGGLRVLYDGCLAVMPVDDAVVIAFQSPRLFPVWLDAVRAAGHKFERMLWLYKINDETFPWRGWITKSEAILVSSVGRPEWLDVHPYVHDVYRISSVGQELPKEWGKVHASVKPLVVVQDLVSRIGGIVYDPFLGSGTTLVTCEQLQRRGRGIEIYPPYIAVCLERLSGMGLDCRKVAGA